MDVVMDAALTKKMDKKAARKRKSDAGAGPNLVEEGNQNKLSKVEKKRKKEKRKTENNTEVDDGYHDEKDEGNKKKEMRGTKVGLESSIVETCEKNCAEADDNCQFEKDNKKQSKSKHVSDDQTNDEIYNTEKKNMTSKMNDKKLSKLRAEKKEQKKKKSKETGILVEKDSNEAEVVKEHDISQKASYVETDGKEEKSEKKKKKKSKETGILVEKDSNESEVVKEHDISQKASSVGTDGKEEKSEKKKKKKLKETGILVEKDSNESEVVKEHDISQKASSMETDDREEKSEKKKKKKVSGKAALKEDKIMPEANSLRLDHGGEQSEKKKKKKVREKSDNKGKGESTAVGVATETAGMNRKEIREKKRKRENKGKNLKDGESTTCSTRNRSKVSEAEAGKLSNDQKTNGVESNSNEPNPKKKTTKKVRFSDQDEVFPFEGKLVRGKRFTPNEDNIVKQAVLDYIEVNNLGPDGLKMVLNCRSHSNIRNCWKEIGQALPYRPYEAVYHRAHTLFERGDSRKWDKDELELIRKYVAEHGPKWKQLADGLGKHRHHIKDAWRRTKVPIKRGYWSQDEYQKLFDLVNADLKAKVNEEKKSKHGMLKDNIAWTSISDVMASRSMDSCCIKWYDQLTSAMVKEGEWADTDDYRLIEALYNVDACCIEDVEWDCLLEHRSGDACRKRWNQMANHIGEHVKKTFVEQVEILSKRYCPELIEAREAWDNKPTVD